jgi:hypothetical protein
VTNERGPIQSIELSLATTGYESEVRLCDTRIYFRIGIDIKVKPTWRRENL